MLEKIEKLYRLYESGRILGYSKKEALGYVLIKLGLFKRTFAIRGNANMRYELALAGYCPDVLFKDVNPRVRAAVAANGKYLEVLLHDPIKKVRDNAEIYIYHYLQPEENDIMTII